MKKILLIAALVIVSFNLFAQPPAGMGGNAKGGMTVPRIGHIYGKLVDSLGKPVNDASVVLLESRLDTVTKKRKEVLFKGLSTKANGEFSFDELPLFPPLKLKISATGYKPIEQSIAFQMKPPAAGNTPKPAGSNTGMDFSAMNAFDKDLGNLTLKIDIKQLQDVTVTGTTGRLKMDIDKKVFNVDKNMVSAGGTAVDVMKNVPSVQVDIDGNVKLRNATPQLFIEGRPTTLSLDQIPADAIESVEVITNPSAKYDASGGTAGILNIVLKKNRKTGYNGNLRAGVDKRGGINAGGDFSIRQGKVNISASAMVNQIKGRSTGVTDQLNLFEAPARAFHQESLNKTNGAFMFAKLGIDYFVTNRTTLSLNGVRVHGQFKPFDQLTSSITKGSASAFAARTSNSVRKFDPRGLQFGMKHLFQKSGRELTADANYFSVNNSGSSLYRTDSSNAAHLIYSTELQKQISSGNFNFLTAQTDYVNPVKNGKIEAGLRVSVQKVNNLNETFIQRNNAGNYSKIPSATSDYSNTNNVYAAYTTFTNSIKNFGYQLGLRAESSDYTGELHSTDENFNNSYPISLFPSVFLSQKLKADQQVQLNYSRRINRPNFFQLIPFTDRTDPLNITRGNPDLVPEFTNSLEASYSKTFKKNNNLLTSIYYKRTNNLITRYQQKEIDPILNSEVLVNSYINANSSYSLGSEITSVNYLKKWWDVTTNVNIYNSKINTGNAKTQQAALWSWFGKINNNFKLPKEFSIQLSGNYQSKTNLPISQGGGMMGGGGPFGQSQSASQGYIKPYYAVDIAVRKNFLKNKAASATLSFSDIFRTRKQEQHSESEYFIQDVSRLRDPQMIRLNLSYRFGKMDMSLFKRKNMKGEMEGTQGAMQGVGN